MGPVHVAKSSDSLPALSIGDRNGPIRIQVLGPMWWMWPASHAARLGRDHSGSDTVSHL